MGRSGVHGGGGPNIPKAGNMKVPGGRYGYRRDSRMAAVAERQEARDSRSPKQQIALLDKRLGKGVGAVKERARLEAMIEAEKAEKKAAKKKEKTES